jgi:hypothetical protein
MANTKYEELADKFFNKILDYNFANGMTEDTAYEIAIGYIDAACNQFESCNQDLDKRDDTLKEFDFELTRNNQVMLVNYMVIEWLTSNYITTSQALKARLSSSDFHALGQKDMLAKALEIRATLKSENDQLAINKSYKKSELYDIVTNRKKV